MRDRLNDLKIELFLLEGQINAALGIFADKISRETDIEEKIKLMIEKSQHEKDKIVQLTTVLQLARENELKMAEADCLLEIGKAEIEKDEPDSALKTLYESSGIMETLLSKNNKAIVFKYFLLNICKKCSTLKYVICLIIIKYIGGNR